MGFDFSTAVRLVSDIGKTAKRLADTREEVKVNEVAIQLQGIVLDLQTEMMMVQSNYQNVLGANEDLKKQLVQHEQWEKDKERYELKFVGNATFVYSLKPGIDPIQPHHWLCTNCYKDGKKSILQRLDRGAPMMFCPSCKTEIRPHDWPVWVPARK